MNIANSEFDALDFGFSSVDQPQWLDAAAVEFGKDQLSYRELGEAVEARTAELRAQGLERQVVTLEIPKSTGYVIDLLAILSARAIVVPIDPSLPELRRNYMLNAVEPALRLEPNAYSEVPSMPISPTIRRDGDTPAYAFFTSGSTGTPKAVLGSRRSLLQFIQWQGREFKVGPGDRISFLSAIGFDVSLRDILLPLLHGATLVIPTSDDSASPHATVEWLIRSRITHVHAVPSIARLWARSTKEDVPSIKTIFLAGEKLTAPAVSEISDAFGGIEQIVNLYGPTETTLAKFYHRLDGTRLRNGEDDVDIPVGKPIPGTWFYFAADGDQGPEFCERPDTSKTTGEVVIVTAHASFGYLGFPDEMNNRFRAGPDGQVAYRTGDLGRLTSNGDLVILGRCDDEVKINGVRIHPLEVEKTIALAPLVRDVAVVARQFSDGEPRLIAFWTANPENAGLPDAAPRDHALSRLPRAMVPTIWARLEALPLNSNGKIDRKKLLELAKLQSEEQCPGPCDALSRWLLKAVADVLAIPTPSLTDDLFALGGTSLHVAFLIGRIEKEFNKSVDFASLFESSRLDAIANLIRSAPTNRKVTVMPIPKAPAYVLSPQQRRWWNIYLPERNRSWATMVRTIPLKGQIPADAIRKAVHDIVVAQDSMRLFFSKANESLRQHVHEYLGLDEIPLSVHDLSQQTLESATIDIHAIRLQIANQEIDPLTWPLFRIDVAAMPNGHTNLIFSIHHMVSDGFSVGLVENGLRNALEQNKPYAPDLPFNYLSYAQWAVEQEQHGFGPGSAAHSYWHEVFREPYQKIVFAEQWNGDGYDRGQGYCCRVPDRIRTAVIDAARRERLTEFSIYLAAEFLAWHDILNRDDLVIGTPAAGRDISGTENLLGNFISLVCVRSRTPDHKDLIDYTREIMLSIARAMTYQGYQFDKLIKLLGLTFEQDRFPLTTIFVSHLNFEALRSRPLDETELGHTDLGFAVKFDLMSYVREHKDATSLQVQYRNNLFCSTDIMSFIDLWLDYVQRIATC